MDSLAMTYYRICVWITRFAYVNLLWIGFTLLGLGVVGFMPSTVAMFAVIRKWVVGETDLPIFKEFLKAFKKEFVKANLLGYGLLLVGYILYIDLQFLQGQSGLFFKILSLIILVLFFIYFIALLYILPLFVHFNLKIRQYFKWSIVISIVHPLVTILMVAAAGVIFYIIFMAMPALILFFGGSAIAFVLMWGSFQTFSKFEMQELND